MTTTNTITKETSGHVVPSLDVSQLETVKWVGESYYYQQAHKTAASKYDHYKTFPLLKWLFATVEIVLISLLLFLHQIPWPEWFLNAVYRTDKMAADSLEWLGNKLDWWWDIFTVRMMRLRDSLENVIDAILSFVLFCFILTSRIFSFFLQVLKVFFLPLIIIGRLIWPEDKASVQELSTAEDSQADQDSMMHPKEDHTETGDLNGSSEYESDVSVLSESKSVSQSTKNGASYSRVDTKLTAEGKLRAIMYKRVKAQLQVMRKHSIRFSKDMASYVKDVLEPKVKPTINIVSDFIYKIAQRFGLVSVIERMSHEVSKYPFLTRQLLVLASMLAIPIKLYNNLSNRRKSRRSRSVRSESLRRRMASSHGMNSNPLIGLSQSTELIKEESLPGSTNDHSECESARDSALASSMDDLPTSDCNDGSVTGKSFQAATIQEEDHTEDDGYHGDTTLHSSNELIVPLNGKSKTTKTPNLTEDKSSDVTAVKSPRRKERPKSMEGCPTEQDYCASSPKLPRANAGNDCRSREDNKEFKFPASPKHNRRHKQRNLKFESGNA